MTIKRKEYKLDQLGFVARGRSRHRPRNDPSLYGGSYPFFQTGDVKAAEMYLHNHTATYNERGVSQSKLWQPGTLCITISANIAESAILSVPGCFPDSIVGFIANTNLSDTAFIKYYMDTLKLLMKNASRGTTQDNLSLDKLLAFDFMVPNVYEQRRIASILSAYDDLIENNTRRIAILEEMARRLYEEWFVKFRFPEHNKTDFVRDLPSGWLRQTVNEVSAYINRGLAPKYDENADCRVINQKCIRDQHLSMEPARRQSKAVPPEKLIRFGDVLINSTGVGTLGRVAQVYETFGKVTADSHVTIVRPDIRVDIDYFGHTLLRLQPFFEGQGVGSTGQTELSRNRIGEAELITPPIDLQKKFGQIVRPMRLLCVRLAAQNANLRAQRDLLLPKLISGEIDVSGAQETLKEAVA